eukprot:CAMPEP_0170974266 /NCGR_PEP_ID=MMETSP0735-20130129/47272_1 /TAXON_ID=186038 /ORGANISM="Fragilariopsis kerguelensis, Strain L26-C5" /LENGTH=304 /DNA_ID=CAMNT_0011395495 /DNA_START=51 /DNA_END=962 /DNA_ORIENTATION=+
MMEKSSCCRFLVSTIVVFFTIGTSTTEVVALQLPSNHHNQKLLTTTTNNEISSRFTENNNKQQQQKLQMISFSPDDDDHSSFSSRTSTITAHTRRRDVLGCLLGGGTGVILTAATTSMIGVEPVSSQAGKSRPVTGVFLRDETEVFRDKRTGDVNAEIILTNDSNGENMATLIQYNSPWPLATGGFYDIECRDSKTSDGAFVQVTPKIVGKKSLDEIPFILDCVFAPSGALVFIGGAYRILDVNFSTLSQATQSELPRKAQIIATIPKGSSQMVLLIASAPAVRWKNNNADKNVYSTIESFRAV